MRLNRAASLFAGVVAFFLASSTKVSAQTCDHTPPVLDAVKFAVTKLGSDVYLIQANNGGGNVVVKVGREENLVIDDNFGQAPPLLRLLIQSISPLPIRTVINTHWHPTHVGGNGLMACEAQIVAHVNVATRMSTTQNLFGRIIPPYPAYALPSVTYHTWMVLESDRRPVFLLHFPSAHTDSDTVTIFPWSKVVAAGDLYFSEEFPIVDQPNGGSLYGVVASLQLLMRVLPQDFQILPGHGSAKQVKDLPSYVKMIKHCFRIVAKKMKAGMTLAQIQAEGLPAKYDPYAHGLLGNAGFIQEIHWDLTHPNPLKTAIEELD